MTDWITQREAAEILQVHYTWVRKLVRRGELSSRRAARRLPSLDRADVLALAERRAKDATARETIRVEKARARLARPPEPPDSTHDWLTVPQAAALVGITRHSMFGRCRRGPHAARPRCDPDLD